MGAWTCGGRKKSLALASEPTAVSGDGAGHRKLSGPQHGVVVREQFLTPNDC